MDMAWSDEDVAFRDEIVAFLDEKLTPELRAAGTLRTSVYADHEASMLQDVKAGRRTEVDAINGAIVQAAQAKGVPLYAHIADLNGTPGVYSMPVPMMTLSKIKVKVSITSAVIRTGFSLSCFRTSKV